MNETEIKGTDPAGEAKTQLQASLTDEKRSALEKYRELTVGRAGFWKFLMFELTMFFVAPLPGALGLVLRKKIYPWLLGEVGSNVIFGRSITIRHPAKIRIDDNTIIDDYAVLDAKGETNQGIEIGKNVIIGRNTVLSCKNGDLVIGNNTNIAMNCFIQSAKKVEVGDNILFAAYCYVIGGGDHKTDRTDIPILSQGQVVKGITIENDCWLGAGVLVCDGVRVGKGTILGAGAVAINDIEPFSVAVGIPAKIVKSRLLNDHSGVE